MAPRYAERDAADAFALAVESVGASAVGVSVGDVGSDMLLTMPDGLSIVVQIKSTSLVTADSAPAQLRRWSAQLSSDVLGVVVADRITAEARDDLSRAGWSWLDLRGHLRLSWPGVFVRADVPTLERPDAPRSGLGGSVSLELAVFLLLNPAEGQGVRAAAGALSRAPSSVSDAFGALRAAGLVDHDRKPAVPALFWELAEHWTPAAEDVARLPGPGEGRDNAALHLGLEEVESTTGWALSDTVAAVDFGAPVAVRADYPPDFYVPDRATMRRAVKLLGPAPTASARAGRIRVAPVSLVCSRRIDASRWASQVWPLADPLFVALDLSRDPGRGREVLEAWTPREPWSRVW